MEKDILLLLDTLEKKNSYLLEFHKINLDEINRLHQGCIDNLENFYYSREILLNAIDRLDKAMSSQEDQQEIEVGKIHKIKLEELLKFKKDMVLSILDQDLTILSLVEVLNKDKLSIAS